MKFEEWWKIQRVVPPYIDTPDAGKIWRACYAEAMKEAAEIARSPNLVIQCEIAADTARDDGPDTATQEAIARAIEEKGKS